MTICIIWSRDLSLKSRDFAKICDRFLLTAIIMRQSLANQWQIVVTYIIYLKILYVTAAEYQL